MGGVSTLNPKGPISLIVCMYGGGVCMWLLLPMEARRQTVVLSRPKWVSESGPLWEQGVPWTTELFLQPPLPNPGSFLLKGCCVLNVMAPACNPNAQESVGLGVQGATGLHETAVLTTTKKVAMWTLFLVHPLRKCTLSFCLFAFLSLVYQAWNLVP